MVSSSGPRRGGRNHSGVVGGGAGEGRRGSGRARGRGAPAGRRWYGPPGHALGPARARRRARVSAAGARARARGAGGRPGGRAGGRVRRPRRGCARPTAVPGGDLGCGAAGGRPGRRGGPCGRGRRLRLARTRAGPRAGQGWARGGALLAAAGAASPARPPPASPRARAVGPPRRPLPPPGVGERAVALLGPGRPCEGPRRESRCAQVSAPRGGREPFLSGWWVLSDAASSPGRNAQPGTGSLWVGVQGGRPQPSEAGRRWFCRRPWCPSRAAGGPPGESAGGSRLPTVPPDN